MNKKAILVMIYNNINRGFGRCTKSEEITFETISAEKGNPASYGANKFSFNINELYTFDILNMIVKIVNKLYITDADFYTANEAMRDYILLNMKSLKEKCPVQFSDELKSKWDYVIRTLEIANLLSNENTSTPANARDMFEEVIKAKPSECEGEHGHAHRCGCNHHIKPKENIKKGEIPKSLDCFTSMIVSKDTIEYSDIFMGEIKGGGVYTIEDFFNKFINHKTEINSFMITSKNLEYLFGKLLHLLERDTEVVLNQKKLGDFISKCIIVDANVLFEGEQPHTPLELASKFLEKDTEETDKSMKDELLDGKLSSIVITANPKFSLNLAGVSSVVATEVEVSKVLEMRSKISKSFGIDDTKECLVSCIIRNPKDEDDSILKVKKDTSQFLGLVEIVGIDKLYIDSKLKDKKDIGLLVKEIKDVYNNLEVIYVDIQE